MISREGTLAETRDLCVSFASGSSSRPIIRDLSFALSCGQSLGVAGESGCGKTTLALSLAGLLPAGFYISGGNILFDGKDMSLMAQKEYERFLCRDTGFVFQDPMTSLNPALTVGFQIGERLRLCGAKKKDIEEQVLEALRDVGLPADKRFAGMYPHELSGGMRQRVMIASAMIIRPRLVIADEPTTALDPSAQRTVLELLRAMCENSGSALLMISHSIAAVSFLCTHLLIMYAGRAVETAGARELLERPLHPYTRGLLSSVPSANRRKGAFFCMDGSAAACGEDGLCAFADRCAACTGRCRNVPVKLYPCGNGHFCRCHLYAPLERGEK